MVLSGLIRVNGFLYCLTVDGRFRRHWKGQIRTNDSRLLRFKKVLGVCSECGLERKLTVDHIPPLREVAEHHKRVLVCHQCHNKKNKLEAPSVNAVSPNFVQSCGLGHNTYLLDNLDVYCRVCNRVVNHLVHVDGDNYETIYNHKYAQSEYNKRGDKSG